MHGRHVLSVSELTAQSFSPYGWMLGKPLLPAGEGTTFNSPSSDFRHEHAFKTGDGEPEILWVVYRDADVRIDKLEMHRLTEQVLIPLTGEIIQIVAVSSINGAPDPNSFRAFRVPVGQGLCMRPGCWHASRVTASEVTCAMITRRSTTIDLINHMKLGHPLAESEFAATRIRLST